MSRGLGRIERRIVAILKSRSAYYSGLDAFSAEQLADDIYDDAIRQREETIWNKSGRMVSLRPRRSHRLSVIRAMHSLARKYPKRYGLTGGKGTTRLYIYRAKRPPPESL
jgi:hypothetical protein